MEHTDAGKGVICLNHFIERCFGFLHFIIIHHFLVLLAATSKQYGLDTAEFSYNPSESNRFQQATTPTQTEERSRCSIM